MRDIEDMDESVYEPTDTSTCCGASVYIETDICSDCKEHCDVGEIMMNKVKWTSRGGIGIEEPKKHIPQSTSWITRLLQSIKRRIKWVK